MILVIDRIENNIAYCEDNNGKIHEITTDSLPVDVKPGDSMVFADGKWLVDDVETKKRYDRIAKKYDQAFRRKK